MNYDLTAIDKGYNISFCDGFISLITGFSGLPYSIRHWELSNKGEAKYSLGHKAIALLEAIPVLGGLVALMERIVVCTYNKFFASQNKSPEYLPKPTSTPILKPAPNVEPVLPVDIESYEALRKEMRQKGSALYVKDETGRHSETLLEVLGKGGSKKAIQIARGRALILPNMDTKPAADIARRWERMVLEEVKMSKILNRLGLLSPLLKKVSITPAESIEHSIPAYISETFENLSVTKGWFIIDTKNRDSSTWKEGEHFLFKSDEERLDDKNWDSIIDPLLTDIAKICLHDIAVDTDSLNIAIVKKPSETSVCPFEVRYFGFDFSSERGCLNIPDIDKRSSARPNLDRFTRLLDRILENVFSCEFGQRYDYGDESEKLRDFKDRLVQKYSKQALARMS